MTGVRSYPRRFSIFLAMWIVLSLAAFAGAAPGHKHHGSPVQGVTVERFGAAGDGTADDSDALNAAFANGGKIVFGHNRRYLVTKRLYIPRSGTEIDLNGSSIVASSGMIIAAAPDSTARKYNGVSDLAIYNGELRGISLGLIHGSNITVRRVSFINMNGSHSMQISACSNVLITECLFSGLKSKGEKPHYEHVNLDPCNHTAFPYFNRNSPTYDGTKNKNITVDRCSFKPGNGEYNHFETAVGVHYDDGAGNLHDSVRVVRCDINGASKWAVRLNACQNSSVEGCNISTYSYAFDTGHSGIRSRNIAFRNNNVRMLDKEKMRPVNVGPHRTEKLYLHGNTFSRGVGQSESLIYFNKLADNADGITFSKLQRTPVAKKISGGKVQCSIPLTQLNTLYVVFDDGRLGKENIVKVSAGKKFRVGEKLPLASKFPGFMGSVTVADDQLLVFNGVRANILQVYGALENQL